MENVYEQLHKDGIAVIENFFSEEEVSEMLKAGKQLCFDAPRENRVVFSAKDSSAAQNREKYFLESGDKIRYFFEAGAVGPDNELLVAPEIALNKVGHALHTDHPIFKKYTFHDKVQDVLIKLKYQRPACCQSMYIFKNPGVGGEVFSHQDCSYLYTEPISTVGFWIPLEDATIENGCLKAIKGSNKDGVHTRYIRNPDKTSNEFTIYDKERPEYPMSEFVEYPVKKGSLVLIHGLVVHRSEVNKSEKSRHAYTFHVIETKDTKYCEKNWLQPNPDKPFPIFYEN